RDILRYKASHRLALHRDVWPLKPRFTMANWTPAFLAKGGSSLLFHRLELKTFEDRILSNPKATERDAAHFFSRFPKFLFLGVGTEIRRESVLVGPEGEPIGRV